MTPATTTSLAEALPVLTERVVAAAARFPADGLVAGPADTQEVLDELLPAEDAFVLVVPAGPAPSQRLVLVVRPSLLKALGLSDADGLADALSPVIAELAGPHEVHEDQVRLGIGSIGLADVPASGGGSGETLVASGLFLGTDHVATVGIGIPGDGDDPGDVEAGDAPPTGGMDLPEVESPRPGTAGAGDVVPGATEGVRSLSLLRNVEMDVTAELGRSRMTVADLLSLTPGSVVELDKVAGSPIDLLVNGTLIARGEVVVIDEEFGVRISEIVDRAEDH
ncbi:MAG: flagellar motor switch protein FliN [Acidimicrobiales bacterium]|nr:flagellar motor switch protein FliN [Acidimicrobiales bacterium]